MTTKCRGWLGGVLGLALIGSGCKHNGVDPSPTITVSLSKSALSIDQGGSDQVGVTVTGAGGFSTTATVSVEGAPAGVTGSVSGVSTNDGKTTATVTVAVAATTVPGNYPITVRASGSGVAAVTANLALTVNPLPAVAMALTPSAVTVLQGGTGTVDLALTRTNFTGPVTLALDGAPNGVTGTFAPQPATGNASVLTIQVASIVAIGSTNLTIRASGAGITATTATLALTVTQPIGVALSAAPVSISAGASGTSDIAITRTNFGGAVALTAEGLPTGVTATFNPASATGTASVLTLDVGGGVAPAEYPVTIRGTASGLADATAALALTVTAPQGGFTLAVTPGSIGVSQGGGSAALVSISRTGGFTGPVGLTVSGAPAGLTATVPATAAGTSTSLHLAATGNLALGTYPLSITGTAAGLPDHTVTIDAVVNVANVDLTFAECGTGTPIWLAIQNGVGAPWIEHLAPAGRFKTRLTTAKAAIAFVTAGFGNNHSLLVQYMESEELMGARGDVLCGNPAEPTRTATASTVNLTASQVAFVAFGDGLRTFSSALPGGTLSGIAPGMHDLIAHVQENNGGFTAADRLIIRRDLNPPNGGSLGAPLDFTGVEAVAPISATITITGLLPGEQLNSAGTQYLTASSCRAVPLWAQALGSGATSFTAYGVPPARQRPTDVHQINVSAIEPATSYRQVSEFAGPLANRTIALPAPLPVPTVTSLTAAYTRLQFEFVAPQEAADVVTASYGLLSGAATFLTATAGWLGGTNVTLAAPDFSQSADWSNVWAPPLDPNPMAWTITAAGSVGCGTGRSVGLSRNGLF